MNNDQKIEVLLNTKRFEALSDEERSLVLASMSQEDYELEHLILTESTALLNEDGPHPDTGILVDALNSFSEEKKSSFLGIFNHQIPTWSAVAAILLLLLVFVPMVWFGSETVTVTVVEHIPVKEKQVVKDKNPYTMHLSPEQIEDTAVTDLPKKERNVPSIPQEKIENTPTLTGVSFPSDMFALNEIDLQGELNRNKRVNTFSMINDSIGRLIDTAID